MLHVTTLYELKRTAKGGPYVTLFKQTNKDGHRPNVIKLTENEKEAGVCLYVSEQTPANTYSKTA